MADPFFSFVENELGLSHDKPDSKVVPAKEDEIEFDLLNDETFGDCAEDGDWEAEHKKLAMAEKTNDSGFDTVEKKYKGQEEFMEQSISHLMLEDEEEDERNLIDDPAVVNASKTRPIPVRKKVDMDDLFGPSSPPALLLDQEQLASPSHRNIWGSPSRSDIRRRDDIIHKFLEGNQDPCIVKAGQSTMSSSLPSKTASEIESDLKVLLTPHIGAVTLEEVERQMTGGGGPQRVTTYAGGEPHPKKDNGQRLHIPAQNGRASPVQGIPQQAASPLLSHFGRISPIPSNLVSSPGMPLPGSPAMPRLVHTPTQGMGAPVMSPLQARLMSPMFRGPPPGFIGCQATPQQMMLFNNSFNGPYFPRGGRNVPSPTRQMFANRMMQHAYTDPRDTRIRSQLHVGGQPLPRQSLFRHPSYGYKLDGVSNHSQPGWSGDQRSYSPASSGQHPQDANVDDYANLMTQKEKDWVIKIQLLQLQTENPFLDDYYFTALMTKKMAMERQKKEGKGKSKDDHQLLLPQLTKETNTYKPAQFEGSLGRLTASSVHNPRKIIDVASSTLHHEDDHCHVPRYRQLLMDIENNYNILLDIGDLEKKILALPAESQDALIQKKEARILELYTELMLADKSEDQFVPCMGVRKGRKLVARAMVLFSKEQNLEILSAILRNIAIIMKKDQTDNVLEQLYYAITDIIQSCDMNLILKLTRDIKTGIHQNKSTATGQFRPLLLNKFGISLVCILLSQAEDLHTRSPDTDTDVQWLSFVRDFSKAMADSKKMCLPYLNLAGVEECLTRMNEPKVLEGLGEKISLLCQS